MGPVAALIIIGLFILGVVVTARSGDMIRRISVLEEKLDYFERKAAMAVDDDELERTPRRTQ